MYGESHPNENPEQPEVANLWATAEQVGLGPFTWHAQHENRYMYQSPSTFTLPVGSEGGFSLQLVAVVKVLLKSLASCGMPWELLSDRHELFSQTFHVTATSAR